MHFRLRGLAKWVDVYWREAVDAASTASEDGLIPPPRNPPTLDCLGGQCLRQSFPALLFALALHDCSVESNWRAMALSAGWHTAVVSPGARRNGAKADCGRYHDYPDSQSIFIPRQDVVCVYPTYLLQEEKTTWRFTKTNMRRQHECFSVNIKLPGQRKDWFLFISDT